jgi:signal transduction histidine kinase
VGGVTPDAWLLLVAGALALLVAWAAWTLTRLRRLEDRVARAWAVLDDRLEQRAALVADLAADHADALGEDRATRLKTAAHDARDPLTGDRELAENALGRELRALPHDLPGVHPVLLEALAEADARMALARRFYNDAVRDTHLVRQGRLPRLLRLHADRPLPRFFDVEDGLDVVLAGAGTARG